LETQGRLTDAVEQFLDHLRVERGASAHTIAAYSNDLAQAGEFFGPLGIAEWSDLSSDHLFRFQASLKRLSATTQMRRMSSLRSFLKYLKKQGKGPGADLPSVGGIRKPKRLPKALSIVDLGRLLGAPDVTRPEGLRDRALMEMVYGAGLRVTEAVDLRIEELDLDTAAFRVTGKRGKTRWLPLPRATLAWIERYLAEARPKLLKKPMAQIFVGTRGGRLSRQNAYMSLQKYAKAAGIEKNVGPHVPAPRRCTRSSTSRRSSASTGLRTRGGESPGSQRFVSTTM
jgi:integrase/recombinase XerD